MVEATLEAAWVLASLGRGAEADTKLAALVDSLGDSDDDNLNVQV